MKKGEFDFDDIATGRQDAQAAATPETASKGKAEFDFDEPTVVTPALAEDAEAKQAFREAFPADGHAVQAKQPEQVFSVHHTEATQQTPKIEAPASNNKPVRIGMVLLCVAGLLAGAGAFVHLVTTPAKAYLNDAKQEGQAMVVAGKASSTPLPAPAAAASAVAASAVPPIVAAVPPALSAKAPEHSKPAHKQLDAATLKGLELLR